MTDTYWINKCGNLEAEIERLRAEVGRLRKEQGKLDKQGRACCHQLRIAIAAEREACALMVENHFDFEIGHQLAAAIRGRGDV